MYLTIRVFSLISEMYQISQHSADLSEQKKFSIRYLPILFHFITVVSYQ